MSIDFCKSYSEAEARYKKWKNEDPFPHIQPALLNSADIADYIRQTGMIYPFYPDKLRGATYEVALKGLCVSFTKDAKSLDKDKFFVIGKDDPDLPNAKKNQSDYRRIDRITLEPNSIAYVTLEPVFQIPNYMALRFNLIISHVYKGLLLGTGPIIDPGFQGRLSIPLHNLTSNRYEFDVGESMITLEFTKMSPNDDWVKRTNDMEKSGTYIAKSIPANRQIPDYLDKALRKNQNKTVISSVVSATESIKSTAEKAMNKVKTIRNIGIGAVISIVVAIFAIIVSLLLPTFQLIKSVDDTQASYSEKIAVLEERLEEKERELEDIQQRFTALEDTVANMEGVRDEN